MRYRRNLSLFVATLLLASAGAVAQDPPPTLPADVSEGDGTDVVRVELTDGSVLVGTIIRETDDEIVVVTVGGTEVAVPREQIRQVRALDGRIVDGRLVVFDPNRTRLFFSPTARPLGRGQGYVASYQIVVPFVAYGITDEISIAGGTILFPGLFGRVLYIAPKVTLLDRNELSVALGGVGLGASFEGESTTAGIGYGLVTYGTPQRAVTLGVGIAAADGELASGLIVTLGGEMQVSNSIKLLSENYLIPVGNRYEPIFSFGVRFFGQRLAADLGGFTSIDLLREGDIFPFMPWVGFAYNFGG